MQPRALVAIIGDFAPRIVAHQSIDECFRLATESPYSLLIERKWIPTENILSSDGGQLKDFAAIWCVPGSPYRNTDGALWAIQFARTHRVPFLGTCGGFQHALLEYARNVLHLRDAAHAETDPETSFPLLHRMQCSLVEKTQKIMPEPGSRFREFYGADSGTEGFHCSYGLNPKFESLFKNGPLRISARSEDGEVRGIELRDHPFFIGTLFQPERRALQGELHPIIAAFFKAAQD
jgi:CTP synthase (UTP-ammonia lyase)